VFLAFIQTTGIVKQKKLIDNVSLIKDPSHEQMNLASNLMFMDHILQIMNNHILVGDEFLERRGAFNFLIKNWLNLIYPLLKEKMRN